MLLVPRVGQVAAGDLQIAGLTPMSSVDWPGKLVATVFTQGCPWACSYCHNFAILDPRIPGVVDWSRVEELMARRHGLLDGVLFSGGEATRQVALVPAMRAVREWGFAVGLHTAGPYPQRLEAVLDEGLVDWVGLDIKALPEDYQAIIQRPHGGQKAWHSLEVVLAHPGVDYEVRLTVDAAGLDTAVQVATRLAEAGVRTFALQHVRLQGTSPAYRAAHVGEDVDARRADVEGAIGCLGFERFIVR